MSSEKEIGLWNFSAKMDGKNKIVILCHNRGNIIQSRDPLGQIKSKFG